MPKRKMSWALIIWTIIMAIWAIAGGSSADCGSQGDQYSQAGCQAGTGIAIALIIVIWFIGFVVLSLIWFMTRPRKRECPACGHDVKRGMTVCQSCGYDFAAGARMPTTTDVAGP